jgi:hypothetical protein
LHRALDRYATLCCPVGEVFGQDYHWSLMQVEYATDLAFRSTTTLRPLYQQLIRETVLSVKAEQIATFLGRQITPLLAQEIGSVGDWPAFRDTPSALRALHARLAVVTWNYAFPCAEGGFLPSSSFVVQGKPHRVVGSIAQLGVDVSALTRR